MCSCSNFCPNWKHFLWKWWPHGLALKKDILRNFFFFAFDSFVDIRTMWVIVLPVLSETFFFFFFVLRSDVLDLTSEQGYPQKKRSLNKLDLALYFLIFNQICLSYTRYYTSWTFVSDIEQVLRLACICKLQKLLWRRGTVVSQIRQLSSQFPTKLCGFLLVPDSNFHRLWARDSCQKWNATPLCLSARQENVHMFCCSLWCRNENQQFSYLRARVISEITVSQSLFK